MSNDRLSNLAILSIEKDLSKNICLEEVVVVVAVVVTVEA